ncbi:hypothetical protein P3602_12910 [Vibrio parahaemolyticus]|uniref:hypothetical protein n=2 Tax=Vibrio parahaemolyticus TaxID=670 RepID=UPI0012E2BB65|nr:hypothetical protein [Vibrio parahaemolyticus]MCR9647417.1 hypothetical protein [Vibrio parahaemolyticus]MCR9767930.1 hypothetical protein [Vibrio parahaemolyticus]MCR9800221.1 hypothetical protein [Vibrio parahaemolyticus]MDF4283865.1 hypothetical protein [Vibrio parahaemolyticus]MDF4315233.1 hypothetical protein [Vibrio parahaemolyticus]
MNNNGEKSEQNRRSLIDELFYGSPENQSTIATEVLRLIDVLPDSFREEFIEIQWLTSQAKHFRKVHSTVSLSTIHQTLHNRKLISKLDIAAFISSTLTLLSYDQNKFDFYKALTLIVVMKLSIAVPGDHRDKIKRLCNEIRQYATGNRQRLVPLLPAPEQHDFQSLIEYFDQQIESDINIDKQQVRRLGYYRNPFRDSYNNRVGINRKLGAREFKQGRNLTISKAQPFDESENEHHATVIELSSKINGSGWQSEDQGLPERSLSLISSKNFVQRDKYQNAMRARAINSRIVKNKMSLTCSINQVSEYDIRCVMSECISILRDNSDYKQVAAATVMLLMIYTGNTLDEINQWKSARSDGSRHIIGIKRRFNLPSAKKLDKQLRFLAKDFEVSYVLPLPFNLVSSLNNFNFYASTGLDVKTVLSNIKKKYHLSVTSSSLANFMKQTMIAQKTDVCIAELISAHDPQNEPARYYTAINTNEFLKCYYQYCDYLSELSQSNYLVDLEKFTSQGVLGSPFFLQTEYLQWLFEKLTDFFSSMDNDKEDCFSATYHNMRVLELQIILGLASGYRPVNDWFGSLNDIHISTGEYRIADKERGKSSGGRVVILPPIALTKLKQYLQFCEEAELYHSRVKPKLAQAYMEARGGDRAFCFYIGRNGVEETTPSSYAEHIDSILPLPPNWTRHYLRSYLYSIGVHDELIAAWMGHQYAEILPFSQFSQLNRHQLTTISNYLQSHLCMLLGKEEV